MLKERTEFVRTILYLLDLAAVTAAFFITYRLFFYFGDIYQYDLMPGVDVIKIPAGLHLYLKAYLLAIALWAALLKIRGQYNLRILTYHKTITTQTLSGFIFLGLFSSAAFLAKLGFVSRMFMVFYTFLSVLSILVNHLLVLYVAGLVRRRGFNYRNILLVGTGARAKDFIDLIVRHKEWGYRIVGLLDREADRQGQSIDGYSIIGTLSSLPAVLEASVVDEVVFVVPRDWLKEIEKNILYCEAVGVPATLSTDFFNLEIAKGVPREMEGKTFLTFETRRLRDPELLVKRSVDILLSSFILAAASPILLLTAVSIRFTSKGPVFFKQTRCGRSGREFTLYKFRSMIENAEQQLEGLRSRNEMTGPVFKMENDPRMTKVGKFLRKTSLDEFPQFWNVLMGDMSIVGPRPPLPGEVAQYEPWQRRRLSMKPGITCLWQVSGRSDIDFETWMKLDLRYIDSWSLWLDIKIVFRTIRAVLTIRGAK